MKTGDSVRDAQGRTFEVGQLLGRGSWARAWAVREGSREYVLKVPLSRRDLGDARLVAACREIAGEQARILAEERPGWLPLVDQLVLADGAPALLLEPRVASLEDRIAGGCTLEELLTTVVGVLELLRGRPPHGNLKPANILLDERGRPWLADPLTPTLRRNLAGLLDHAPRSSGYQPPELVAGAAGPLRAVVDTYALGRTLLVGATHPAPAPDPLDKGHLVELKDAVLNRLRREHSNPRFHSRLADRMAALLNRAVSRQASPSPPFRFDRLDAMLERTREVLALVHPTVESVGQVFPGRGAHADGFTTDQPVVFRCTVGCSTGVQSHEEIATGLAVRHTLATSATSSASSGTRSKVSICVQRLSASSVRRAESTFFSPTRSSRWTICRCRLLSSTASKSTRVRRPTPAAVR